jgi:hypothetical protein
MVDGFDASGDDDLVTSRAKTGSPTQDLSLPFRTVALLVVGAFFSASVTIIGPAKLIPLCPIQDMKVGHC